MNTMVSGSVVKALAPSEQRYAPTLAMEFRRSFRSAADLVIEARRYLRLAWSGHQELSHHQGALLEGLEELRARLLVENFYYRSLELGIDGSPDLLRLARTSSDWRVVLFLSLLQADYPAFTAEYDLLLNLLAANSPALKQAQLGQDAGTLAA